MFIVPPDVQLVPSYSSVEDKKPGEFPPAHTPAVCVPAPAAVYLAVDKSFCSDQELPSYSSVFPLIVPPGFVSPPKAKAAVCVPELAELI